MSTLVLETVEGRGALVYEDWPTPRTRQPRRTPAASPLRSRGGKWKLRRAWPVT